MQTVEANSEPISNLLKADQQHFSMSTRAGRAPRFPLVLELKAKAMGSSNHSLTTYATLDKVCAAHASVQGRGPGGNGFEGGLCLTSRWCSVLPLPTAPSSVSTPSQGGEAGVSLRIVAQKVNADGRSYLLREIYGIEQKRNGDQAAAEDEDEDDEDDDTECVVRCAPGMAHYDLAQPCSSLFSFTLSFPSLPLFPSHPRCCMCFQPHPPGVHVRAHGHDGAALQAPLSVQQLRRSIALPGQQVPHLQGALPLSAED